MNTATRQHVARKPVLAWRTLSAFSVLCLVAACDSGGSSAPPLLDDSGSSAATSQQHWINEDAVFSGRLSSTFSFSESASVAYQVSVEPLHGQLVLEIDGNYTYTPALNYVGEDEFSFFAQHENVRTPDATITFTMSPVYDFPVVTGEPPMVIDQGSAYLATFEATDPDGDAVQFSAVNLPPWMNLSSTTGLMTGVPDQSDVGIFSNIIVKATDTTGLSTEFPPFSVEVLDVNDPPTINASQFPEYLDAGSTVEVTLFPDDVDGHPVTLSTEANDFVSVEILGGSIKVSANDVQEVTDINLVVIATDYLGHVTRQAVPLTLRPVSANGIGRTIQGRELGEGLHVVIMGDGYTQDESALFDQHVEQFVRALGEDPSVRPHLGAWNLHTIFEASQDSGIDEKQEENLHSTLFESYYHCKQIERLICTDDTAVFIKALSEYAWLDQIVLLINDARYGGRGGGITITSGHWPEIALHELGHTIANLADEYVDGVAASNLGASYVEGSFANVSQHNTPGEVPWTHWIDDHDNVASQPGEPGVGIFEGAYYQAAGMYRPTYTSRMRTNSANFGPVNGEQWALSVYRQVRPIISFSPTEPVLALSSSETANFQVRPMFDRTVQSIDWRLNGEALVEHMDQANLVLHLSPGQHEVEVQVADITGIIRKDPPHAGVFNFTWSLTVQ